MLISLIVRIEKRDGHLVTHLYPCPRDWHAPNASWWTNRAHMYDKWIWGPGESRDRQLKRWRFEGRALGRYISNQFIAFNAPHVDWAVGLAKMVDKKWRVSVERWVQSDGDAGELKFDTDDWCQINDRAAKDGGEVATEGLTSWSLSQRTVTKPSGWIGKFAGDDSESSLMDMESWIDGVQVNIIARLAALAAVISTRSFCFSCYKEKKWPAFR